MIINHVNPNQLDLCWGDIEPMLANALEYAGGEITVLQMRQNIVAGNTLAIVSLDERNGIKGVCTFMFSQYANFKACHVLAVGGSDIFWDKEASRSWYDWLKTQGCSKIEGCCRPSMVRLLEKNMDMKAIYTTVRGDI